MSAYYNEIDPYSAQWLRNLIAAGHIAPGDVDERSIEDVRPDDLRGYTQCHFFAGIGVWSYALRRAGWPDDQPVWSGSAPCQPFSAAGQRGGVADERHLWPAFHHLIRECRPECVFGEQVASKDGLGWLDLVQVDMEAEGYALGALDICAAGIGAPHIRQRLWFVGERLEHASSDGRIKRGTEPGGRCAGGGRGPVGLDDATGTRHVGSVERSEGDPRDEARLRLSGAGRASVGLDDDDDAGSQGHAGDGSGAVGRALAARPATASGVSGGLGDDGRPGPVNGFWRDADWLFCRDGKWRPVRSGSFPLAHGAPSRVGRLRAYGNAIVSQVAIAFIEEYMAARSADDRDAARLTDLLDQEDDMIDNLTPEQRAESAVALIWNGLPSSTAGSSIVIIAIIASAIRDAENAALERAAMSVDCACRNKGYVLNAKSKADQGRFCGSGTCDAVEAAEIRALKHKEAT